MHYDYFDFEHTMSDEARVAMLRGAYEKILDEVSKETGRKIGRLKRFLAESDFYAIPCRHHQFVGGNAWHQLETWLYAQESGRWSHLDAMGVAVVCLLHDVCNAGYGGERKVDFPTRIRSRKGRKSTYVLVDYLKFDLMFDENMAILHNEHKDETTLRENTPNEEDFEMVWGMDMWRMICECDEASVSGRLTQGRLLEGLRKWGVVE